MTSHKAEALRLNFVAREKIVTLLADKAPDEFEYRSVLLALDLVAEQIGQIEETKRPRRRGKQEAADA